MDLRSGAGDVAPPESSAGTASGGAGPACAGCSGRNAATSAACAWCGRPLLAGPSRRWRFLLAVGVLACMAIVGIAWLVLQGDLLVG